MIGFGDDVQWAREVGRRYRKRGLEVEIATAGQATSVPAAIVHVRGTFAQHGNSVSISDSGGGRAMMPVTLARTLGPAPRMLILHAPPEFGASSAMRTLILRNAFAAELFELTELEALLALGPFIAEEAELKPFDLVADGIGRMARGELTLLELATSLRAQSGARGLATALFSNDPALSISPATE